MTTTLTGWKMSSDPFVWEEAISREKMEWTPSPSQKIWEEDRKF